MIDSLLPLASSALSLLGLIVSIIVDLTTLIKRSLLGFVGFWRAFVIVIIFSAIFAPHFAFPFAKLTKKLFFAHSGSTL